MASLPLIQRVVETLHERHGAALRGLQSQEFAGAAAEFAKDGPDENIQHLAHQAGVIGQTVAQREWNRQHPLPNGNFGKDVVNQVSGRLRHSSPATARTPPAPAARKRDEAVVTARLASLRNPWAVPYCI